jgi:mannosyltransferase
MADELNGLREASARLALEEHPAIVLPSGKENLATAIRGFGLVNETTVLLLILVAAAVLRFWDIDRTSLFHDEGISFYQADRPFYAMLMETAKDNYPPLHNIILWFTIRFVGVSETLLRLPSAIMGVGAVYGIYRIGSMFGPRGTGLAAAGMLAVLPMHVWHSVEARMYSLLTFAAICFMWATIVHWQRHSLRSTVILAFATLVLLMSHAYGSLAIVSADAYLLLRAWWTNRLRDRVTVFWLGSQMIGTILFLPWIVVLANRSLAVSATGFWIAYPDMRFIVDHVKSLLGTFPLVALIVLGFYYLFRLAAAASRPLENAASRYRISFETGLLLASLLGPFALAYAISHVAFPILYNRYLLVSVPAALLLLSRAVLGLHTLLPVRLSLIVALIVSFMPEAIHRVTTYNGERHDLRSAAAFMMNLRHDGDLFMPVQSYLARSMQYYTGRLDGVVLRETIDQLLKPPPSSGRIWIVFSWDGMKIRDRILQNYEKAGFEQELRAEYYDTTVVLLQKNPLTGG